MLRLAISRNLQILPKNLAAFTSSAVNGLSNCLNQTASVVAINYRLFSLSTIRLCEAEAVDRDDEGENVAKNSDLDESMLTDFTYKPHLERKYKRLIGTDRDRTVSVPYETSIEYLKSSAYKDTYGDEPVWVKYRRVHKGQLPKFKTRRSCTTLFHKYKLIWNNSPCPICRDKYLVLNEMNVDLLKQFISPYTGEILCFSKTNICQKEHFKLRIAVERAFDMGLLQMTVPFREFNYADYYDLNSRSNIVHLKKSDEF